MLSYKSYLSLYHSPHFSNSVCEVLSDLAQKFPHNLSLEEIGFSVLGTPLIAAKLGSGPIKILIHGTHHAREAITTILLLDQIYYLIKCTQKQALIKNISICQLLRQVTFIFVPLVNPDGADLVLNGSNAFSSWKANRNGIDLNENYPTKHPYPNFATLPGPELYPGPFPFSEPETLALKSLTEKEQFAGTLSYHSSGEEIYWYYNQKNDYQDLSIASQIAIETGYKLMSKHLPTTGSGYKDWFIETYHRPGLTIEVAPYIGPRKVPSSYYKSIYQKNKNVPILFASILVHLLL